MSEVLKVNNIEGCSASVNYGALTPDSAVSAALIDVMKNFILESVDREVYSIIDKNEEPIRSYLSVLSLNLNLDRKYGIAFVTSKMEERSLISKQTLSVFDTLILLILRKRFQEQENAGESLITIDIEHIKSCLIPFGQLTDRSQVDEKKINGSLAKMIKRKILRAHQSGYKYIITPIIRFVVHAEMLENLLKEYEKLGKVAELKTGVVN